MLPTNVMSFMKKMVATEDTVPGQIESPGTFGKLRQTLSSSLLTAQDKVTKLGPRTVVTESPAEPAPAPPPVQPTPTITQPTKTEREAGKAPSRAGACRVCLKALKPGEVFHICNGCQHRVCEDCSSYSKPASDDESSSWRCSVCRRKAGPRLPPAAQDSTDSLLDVPVLEALQRRHSEARLGSGGSSTALAPPRSPELRRHSDVSPASLKELEKLKGGGSTTPNVESRRPSTATPARRRSVRAPTPRQRSVDEDKNAPASALVAPPPMSRRASAVDVVAGAGSRRSSYRPEVDTADSTPQISGLSVDEDRPIRRRGSQLPDIAALQQRTGALNAMAALTSRGSDASEAASAATIAAAAAAAAAAARQMSVDAEAIKIVIHDVDDRSPRRVSLRRDPNDKGHRSRGFGMRVVGGKPDASGRREAVIVWTVPGGPADAAGLQQGDKVLEWGGVPLTERSFEEVCAVLERSGDSVELLVEPAPQLDEPPAPPSLTSHHHHALYEPETDKSPSSPTRRKLPKTPEQDRAERARERPPARAQLQVWFENEIRKLVVVLIAADDLPPRDHTLGYGDEPEAFARIRLLPSLESCPPVETDPASASCTPVWNATLGFGGLTADLLAGRALELTLWDACPGIDPVLIGECTMELEKAFADERAVWWTLEERGTRSANASPRGSLTGARALRRGDFASQRSVSDDVDSIGECASLLHPDHAWVAGSRRGSSQSETLEVEVYQLGKDFSRSLPGSRRSSFQQQDKDGGGEPPVCSRRSERRRSSCVRRDPDDILRSLRAVKGELGRTLSLSGSTARRTATGRKGSMWAAVPAAAACDAVADDDEVPLGPGQLPPRNAHLPPLHAEINLSIIMIKGQLELEVSHARRVYGVNGEVPDSYVKCYLRDGEKWLHKRKTRVIRRTTEPHFKQTLKYQASESLGRTLVVMLWQRCGGFEHNLALGGAEICLDKLTLPQRTYGWYPLFPATSLAADESPD
ncbi:regulating synaptic membrane exocytosis protein 1 [Vanessa tameamea]|uniref:Regulating synaptic membrane exocytosis protein 1 n=1 Tax=Vanessa tameamea TaxID=334116 RepID=A0A8B8HQN6_VANTA|nr:regulating synaptic membrane exocytosis protein 1 isoform X1 [Vanessa tameamea]XP_026486867.1 regulating synaptic membrane exocytosis protein 1 isoform X1 [Vanessa tameamea]XP_047534700.1 regulating synaptic membrane exocytosis protein 1 [Vanessa atalanta]